MQLPNPRGLEDVMPDLVQVNARARVAFQQDVDCLAAERRRVSTATCSAA